MRKSPLLITAILFQVSLSWANCKVNLDNPQIRCLIHFDEGAGTIGREEVTGASVSLVGGPDWVQQAPAMMGPELLFSSATFANFRFWALSYTNTTDLFTQEDTVNNMDLTGGNMTMFFTYQMGSHLGTYRGGVISFIQNGANCSVPATGWAIDIDGSDLWQFNACGIGSGGTIQVPDLKPHRYIMRYDWTNQIFGIWIDAVFKGSFSNSRAASPSTPRLRFMERPFSGHTEPNGTLDEFSMMQELCDGDDALLDYAQNSVNGEVIVTGGH